MSSTPVPPGHRAPTFHKYHNHGAIPFMASDGTILMADRWRLARVSGFFADMLELPPPPGMTRKGSPTPKKSETASASAEAKPPIPDASAFTREDIPGALCDPIPTDTAAPVLDLFLN